MFETSSPPHPDLERQSGAMAMVVYAILLVVGVVLLLVTTLRVLVGGIADSSGGDRVARPVSSRSARAILDERYAAGELSVEEYQHRLRVLEGGR
jgi:putative membrane protein